MDSEPDMVFSGDTLRLDSIDKLGGESNDPIVEQIANAATAKAEELKVFRTKVANDAYIPSEMQGSVSWRTLIDPAKIGDYDFNEMVAKLKRPQLLSNSRSVPVMSRAMDEERIRPQVLAEAFANELNITSPERRDSIHSTLADKITNLADFSAEQFAILREDASFELALKKAVKDLRAYYDEEIKAFQPDVQKRPEIREIVDVYNALFILDKFGIEDAKVDSLEIIFAENERVVNELQDKEQLTQEDEELLVDSLSQLRLLAYALTEGKTQATNGVRIALDGNLLGPQTKTKLRVLIARSIRQKFKDASENQMIQSQRARIAASDLIVYSLDAGLFTLDEINKLLG